MSAARVVEPGGLLAILGGGQLGRMTAMAARRPARSRSRSMVTMDSNQLTSSIHSGDSRTWCPIHQLLVLAIK